MDALRYFPWHSSANGHLRILGKLYQEPYGTNNAIESSITAEGSIASVMDGRQCNKPVRVHKCVYESLMRLAWRGFPACIDEVHSNKKGLLVEAWNLYQTFVMT